MQPQQNNFYWQKKYIYVLGTFNPKASSAGAGSEKLDQHHQSAINSPFCRPAHKNPFFHGLWCSQREIIKFSNNAPKAAFKVIHTNTYKASIQWEMSKFKLGSFARLFELLH